MESYRILCSTNDGYTSGYRSWRLLESLEQKKASSRTTNQNHGISFQEKQRIEKCAAVQKNDEKQEEIVRGGEKIGEKQHHEVQSTVRKI